MPTAQSSLKTIRIKPLDVQKTIELSKDIQESRKQKKAQIITEILDMLSNTAEEEIINEIDTIRRLLHATV